MELSPETGSAIITLCKDKYSMRVIAKKINFSL